MTIKPLPEMQELTLRTVKKVALRESAGSENPNPAFIVDTQWVNEQLYDDVAKERGNWTSRSEAAQGHISALVKKGLLERPWRGGVNITAKGLAYMDYFNNALKVDALAQQAAAAQQGITPAAMTLD